VDVTSTLLAICILGLITAFTHILSYKYSLFHAIKIDLQQTRYPLFAGILTLVTLASYIFSFDYLPWYWMLITMIIYLLAANKTLFLTLFKDKHTLPITSVWWDAFVGFILFIVAYPALSLANNTLEFIFEYGFNLKVPQQTYIDFIKQIKQNTSLFVTLFFMGSVIIPLFEEFIYRANIQTWLKNYLRPYSAILITSLFFGLSHFFTIETFQGKFVAITLTGLASVYLGWGYERQRSLVTSVVFHGCLNAQTFLLAYFTT
jgi:membrane protease YdiL (CAAX protease family)